MIHRSLIALLLVAPSQAERLKAAPLRSTAKVGETVEFRVESPTGGKATWSLGEDLNVAPLARGVLDLPPGKAVTLPAKLDHPGFLLLEVRQGDNRSLAAAAIEPDRIASVAREPEDFDAFWEGERKALNAVPLNARTVPRRGATKVVLEQVEGRQVHGWIAIPEGKGPFPAILEFPAFGAGALPPPLPMPGAIQAIVSVHDTDPEAPAGRAYTPACPEDHRKNYFKYAVLGGLRMIDHLASLPQVDGKRLVVTGKSQGGGLAIMVAGLDSRVTHLSAVVPAFGQHAGTRNGRSSGFPNWVWQKDKDGLKTEGDRVLVEAEYYETAHFAKRFKGRAHVMAAWIDTVCPPSTVLAAFNRFPGEKEIVHGPLQDHDWARDAVNWWPIRQEALKKFLR